MLAHGFHGHHPAGQPESGGGAGHAGLSLGRRSAGDAGRGDRRGAGEPRGPGGATISASAASRRPSCSPPDSPRWTRPASATQDRMLAAARGHGMRLLGPNCLGAFDGAHRLLRRRSPPRFESGLPMPGPHRHRQPVRRLRHASCSRSRAIAASARSLCVTTGNEGDVTVGDVIGWMAEDPDTDVIAAYAEGMREADSFLAALAAAQAAKKPVVMMKVGRSALGTRGRQVAHRLDRRRRRRDRGGAQRVRRGPRAHHRGNARHRPHRDPPDLPGAQHARRASRSAAAPAC